MKYKYNNKLPEEGPLKLSSFLTIREIIRAAYLFIKESNALFTLLYPKMEKTQVFDDFGNKIPNYEWDVKTGVDYETIHLNFIRINLISK